jgi:spermidine/putrescine-binding protein
MDPQWVDVDWDPGRHYSVPWQWGSTGVAVNREDYKGDINTSKIFLDPPEELVGKVNVVPEMADVMALALMYVSGESCSTDKDKLKAARDELAARAKAAGEELAAVKASLAKAQADLQAKTDAVASLEKGGADLTTQLDTVRKELAAARSATEKAHGETSAKAAALATAEQGRADVEKQLAAVQEKAAAAAQAAAQKLATAEQEAAAKLAEAERRTKAESEARASAEQALAELRTKHEATERAATEAGERIARLEPLLAEEEKARVAMAAEIDALRAQLPVSAGGTRTVDGARAEAAKAAEVFLAAEQRARKDRSDEAKAALQQATDALRQAQLDVAVAIDAQGVYRLRREDTLAIVAGRYFGKSNRWPEIYEANRHVLADPDRVVPGLTVVVP